MSHKVLRHDLEDSFPIIKRNQAWCEFLHAVFGVLLFITAHCVDFLAWHADVKTVTC